MRPLRDPSPTRRLPVLTIALVLINVAVFVYQLQKPDDASLGGRTAFQCEYGLVADHFVDGSVHTSPQGLTCGEVNAEHNRFVGLFTSMFLHTSWWHLIGNMLFLLVFGMAVEDRMGRIRYLPFYLVCGMVAGTVQALTDPQSDLPVVGASGAIAGILGAYIVLFPRHRAAVTLLVLWFVFQFLYASGVAEVGGGVAYWAHVAGFLAGVLLIKPFMAGRRRSPPPAPPVGSTVWDRGGLP